MRPTLRPSTFIPCFILVIALTLASVIGGQIGRNAAAARRAPAPDPEKRRLGISLAILIVGAALYWLACPAGHPEPRLSRDRSAVDALPLLWFVPIALSELFSSGLKARRPMLAVYAVVTAYIGAGATAICVPHHPNPRPWP